MAAAEFDLCIIVDDDEDILVAARLALRGLFRELITVSSPERAIAATAGRQPDVILLDANFARGATDAREGLALLDRLLTNDPEAIVVMITAHAGVNVAVEAMKRGATDFVSKPWENLIGSAPSMARVHSLIARAAPTEANVLVLGENGTGKELVARALHQQSHRADREMVTVDLGAIATELIDSELFGHVKGAFTDARSDRVGRIQAADGGTLFLDEIGNLPLHLQPKLLTVLEQRKVTPVGANQPIPVDIRVIAATNMTPAMLRDERQFRQDLLFRLNTVEIDLPPLRDRREDVPVLIDHYLGHYAERYKRPRPELSPQALGALVAHDWPGNVRALRHAVERAVILAGDGPLEADAFALIPAATPRVTAEPVVSDLNLDRVERRLVEEALKKHGYNISSAAHELGLSRAALYRRMEKHGL
ncbi:MAG: sigma-54-dependent Fis family transcriptional regulator [Sphingomonadales bacterium]|nr:sigma-54-dependent Fis family transcriptional regulator [Sphingomonadales bacterium]